MIEITNANFEEKVLNSDIPVLVDFWAEWCPPCKRLSPIVEEVSQEVSGKALVVKVNVDDAPELSAKYGVSSIPTLVLINKGEAVKSSVGFIPKEKILELIGV